MYVDPASTQGQSDLDVEIGRERSSLHDTASTRTDSPKINDGNTTPHYCHLPPCPPLAALPFW